VSVERLRNFRQRLASGNFGDGSTNHMRTLALETIDRMRAALVDDLNTAQAQAAIFEMVRMANAALDAGKITKDDVAPILSALDKFDEIFAVLRDDDGPKMKQVLDWAMKEGREDISKELREAIRSEQLSDADIEKKIAEMESARRSRDYKASDMLRAELTTAGIVIENTKDGARWRRK
jgi:cysteinyl-tRNA synthetase